MMVIAWPLFSRDINEARQLISFHIMTTALAKEYLNHSRMIAYVVSRPGASILHCPSFLGNLLGFRNQGIDSYLEFLIFSLMGKLRSCN
jgi:hypothetical protein